MLTRILTVALAAGTLAFATAHAQTSSSGSSTTSPSTTSPSTGSSSTMGSGSSSQQAQQPMSGSFDISKYKTNAECLAAARSASADIKLCGAVK